VLHLIIECGFDTRPDRLFIEHMVQVREVFTMILNGHATELGIGIAATAITALIVFRIFQKQLAKTLPCSLFKRILLLLFCVPLLFIGIRSSFSHRPVNISSAAFSTSHLVNQLGINSTYSLGYAWYQTIAHEQDPSEVYGKMKDEEVLRRIRASNNIKEQQCTNPNIPLLHYQPSGFPRQEKLNLVIILEERMGAEYVGCLNGLPLTPSLDRLSSQGLLFTNLYCTGTRTVRGIEAIISGFLPTPGTSVLKLGRAQSNFFSIAEVLRRRGYMTEFIYGGKSTFDNMKASFLGNGFTRIYEQADFASPVFTGTWGVSDEDLFDEAHKIFMAHAEKPFFALVLTTSNHDPFEFPDGRIQLYEQPKMTRHNAIKYADYALGKFFEQARQAPYFANTVFLIIADHSTRLRGEDLIPLKKFHIPGLIIAPGLKTGTYNGVASQIDMTPTLLDIMGISCEHPAPGRPLLDIPNALPGRAVMQYAATHALLEGNNLIVQQPEKEPLQFVVQGQKLLPAELNPELAQDALAYALLPGFLYKKQFHRLPDKDPQT